MTVEFSSTSTPALAASVRSSSPMTKPLIFALCSLEPKNLWICLNSCPPGFSFSSNTTTFNPLFAASIAADRPDGPAPTTIKSYLFILSVLLFSVPQMALPIHHIVSEPSFLLSAGLHRFSHLELRPQP